MTPDLTALLGLLTREGQHSGVWFADKLLEAARVIREYEERLTTFTAEYRAMEARWANYGAEQAARIAELEAALRPFAKAAMGVEIFDPDFPMDGAALRASFDWYDKCQSEPLQRHSVRRSDLERARKELEAANAPRS